MFSGFWHWLKDSTRRAVLAGVQEAIEELALPRQTPAEGPRLLDYRTSQAATPARNRRTQ
jgi:hypothetical protein